MNYPNLYHLKYFMDAAREGGVSHSARLNRVSQSAVSRAIATLERDVGGPLILHSKNKFQLTEAGQELLQKSPTVFDSVMRLKESTELHSKGYRGPLRFGCNQAIASHLIAHLLIQLQKKQPEIKPEIKLGNTDQIQKMLDQGEIDFGVVMNDGEVSQRFQTRTLFTGQLVVVKSPRFKGDLADHLLVSRTQKGGFHSKYLRAYETVYHQQIRPKLVVASWQVILDLAIAGYGYALVPQFICVEALKRKKLEIFKSKVTPIPFELCTIVAKKRHLPKNAEVLFELIGKAPT